MSNPIQELPRYLKIFQDYLGRRIYIVFALSLTAGLADGVGIMMLLPLLQTLNSGAGPGAPTGGVATYLYDFLSRFGLQDSTPAILLIITGAFLVKGVLVFGARGYNAYLQGRLLAELKGRLFDAYCRMRYEYYTSRDTGHFVNVVNEQINRALLSFHSISQLVSYLIQATIYLLLASLVAWRFGLMALVVGAALLALFRWLSAFVRNLSRNTARENGYLAKQLIQALHAFKYLVATGQTAEARANVSASIQRLMVYEIRTGVARAFTHSVREPIAAASIMLIVLAQLVFLNQPLAPILVSIVLFYRGLDAVLQIQAYWQNSLEYIGSMELVDEEFSSQREHREADGHRPVGDLSDSITFRDVHFAYDPQSGNVIQDVSFVLPVRTSVALVGPSGAGKSTVVDLITLMLKPQGGQVLIDGVPGDEIQLDSWRPRIGYVSQETVIFDDSIANNISMWEGDPSEPAIMDRVRDAARLAHLAEFIGRLPDGYNTPVGDRGVLLSGGQRQRLFIARELFRRPSLLILDEATSALDSESERAIQQSIDELKGRITVIIIAHRLSTIRNVDRVLVFDQGRLVEQGNYEELQSDEDSLFGRYVAMQRL